LSLQGHCSSQPDGSGDGGGQVDEGLAEPGAALSVTDSTVSGSVTATDPAWITYCGSTEAGNLTVTGATGAVVLSGALPDGTATAPAAITVSGVTLTGSLTCTGNSPAPADAGTLNTVSAVTASDQGTGLEVKGLGGAADERVSALARSRSAVGLSHGAAAPVFIRGAAR
jgi:hypothetical protein